MLKNASYFGFTSTPKKKTLETFGEVFEEAARSSTGRWLRSCTPVISYYRLAKTVPNDPEFDTKKARAKLRRYVESHQQAIRQKAEIMVDHFTDSVMAYRKFGGQARAMVVTGIERAIQYFHAFQNYLRDQKSPYRSIVAFPESTTMQASRLPRQR